MTLFPFFEDIEGKTFLVIGGGRVAAGKVERLRQFTDRIAVIAEESEIDGAILRPFREEDLALGDYVVAATDDRELNRRVADLCRARGIPVNAVDDPDRCTFVFPAVAKRGSLTVAVSTDGKSPAFAKYLRERIEEILPENAEEILDELGRLRGELKETEADGAARGRILRERLAELLCGH